MRNKKLATVHLLVGGAGELYCKPCASVITVLTKSLGCVSSVCVRVVLVIESIMSVNVAELEDVEEGFK